MNALLRIDTQVLTWVAAHRIGMLDTPLWLVSVAGRGGIVWLVVGLVLTVTRRLAPRQFLQLALSVLLATIVADEILKPIVARQRPFEHVRALEVIGGRPDDSSFPSGHAANAFAGAATLSGFIPAARLVWWPLAVTIAYSRVYLGVHHPLDVIGGALVGVACALAISRLHL